MSYGGEPEENELLEEKPQISNKSQLSLETFEWFSPDINKPHIPYITKNKVLDLVKAVSDSKEYIGPKNLEMGNFYYRQERYNRAISNYQLNVTKERYVLKVDKKRSLLGLARCYLKLGDISSSINYFHKLEEMHGDEGITAEFIDNDLFIDLISLMEKLHYDKIRSISNSLEQYELIGDILNEKSGWTLANGLIDHIRKNLIN